MSIRPITDTLRALRGGEFLDEASEALAKVVAAVGDTARPGKLTIELTVRRASRGQAAMVVSDKISLKLPAAQASETMLFATPEGNLVADNPQHGGVK